MGRFFDVEVRREGVVAAMVVPDDEAVATWVEGDAG